MLTLVDYGMGNIKAFYNIYECLGIPVLVASTSSQLSSATKIILPGVGSFDAAMQSLDKSGMRETLDYLVLECSIPVLGICVGMQIMAKSSEEGLMPGLSWLDAHVKRFDPAFLPPRAILPHMGWNNVKGTADTYLLDGIDNPSFYFLHSYYFDTTDPSQSLAVTEYGIEFTSVAAKRNICGVQFHPEKSHGSGVRLLKNFATLFGC